MKCRQLLTVEITLSSVFLIPFLGTGSPHSGLLDLNVISLILLSLFFLRAVFPSLIFNGVSPFRGDLVHCMAPF